MSEQCPHDGYKFDTRGGDSRFRVVCGQAGWLCHACREDRADHRTLAAGIVPLLKRGLSPELQDEGMDVMQFIVRVSWGITKAMRLEREQWGKEEANEHSGTDRAD